MNTVNNKYKTMMCRHYEQNIRCPLGEKCHFAHGKDELRNINDPLPATPIVKKVNQPSPKPAGNSLQYSLPPTISNYKTMKCKYHEKGYCKYAAKCGFAHGDEELRSPNSPLPSNIINAVTPTPNYMPTLYEQTIHNQIAQQQIFYLIEQMRNYHANNQELLQKIQEAFEVNTAGNVQGAASIIYNIINRTDKSKEESESYTSFIQNMQGIGPNLYQQMQMQYTQQANSLGLFGYNSPTVPTNPLLTMTPPLNTHMNMNMTMPFNATTTATTTTTSLPQMGGGFSNGHPQGTGQTQYSGQENGTSPSMTGSVTHFGSTNPMQMLGLTNTYGGFPGMNMANFSAHPMSGASNTSNNKTFGS